MNTDYAAYSAKVIAAWSQGAPDPACSFYLFKPLRQYFQRALSGRDGDGSRDWYERWVISNYLADRIPVAECLSIGCGYGEIERVLARHGVFRRCLALDLSPRAIAAATSAAQAEGFDHIEYRVADLNSIALEPDRYDLIWSIGTLHHIPALEHLIGQLYRTLRPGGYLIANEYVGPNLMQLTSRQLELINAVIHLIPARLRSRSEESFVPASILRRRQVTRLFTVARRLRRGVPIAYQPHWSWWQKAGFAVYWLTSKILGPLQRWATRGFEFGKVYDNDPYYAKDIDPSEGIRASEIIPLIRATFDGVDVRYYSGSILQHVLDGRFFEVFDPDRPEDARILDLLIQIEQTLIEVGEVGNDNASIVARRG